MQPGLKLAIERDWLVMHESGTYVKFTRAGAFRLKEAATEAAFISRTEQN
jgi:hypothetical protein